MLPSATLACQILLSQGYYYLSDSFVRPLKGFFWRLHLEYVSPYFFDGSGMWGIGFELVGFPFDAFIPALLELVFAV